MFKKLSATVIGVGLLAAPGCALESMPQDGESIDTVQQGWDRRDRTYDSDDSSSSDDSSTTSDDSSTTSDDSSSTSDDT